MLEELRISSLGVIDESVLELGPGFTAITGETGAGKTMVVTALGLLLGGRADSGAVRTGARSARVEGLVRSDSPALAAAVDAVGGEVEDGRLVLARQISAEGRSRAFAGGAAVPVSSLASLADPLVAVHGQSDQHRLLRPAAQRDALDSFAGAKALKLRARFGERYAALRATEAELADVVESARERAREADLLRFGLGEVEEVDPQPGEEVALAAEESRLGFADTLRTAAEQARECLSAEDGGPDALGTVSAARKLLDGVREHDPDAAGLADRLAEISYLLSDVAADVASYASSLDTDPARLAAVSERRAALVALTRKYGETIEDVLAWSEHSAVRLLELDNTDERIVELREQRDRHPDRARRPRRRPHRGPDQGGHRARSAGDRRAGLAGDAARDAQHHGRAGSRTSTDSRWGTGPCASGPPGSTTSSCCWPPTGAPSRARSARAPRAVSSPG